jgi:hypothetical protein
MAKIKKINCRPQNWLVRVDVKDPDCVFSIKPDITYKKIVKAMNANAAIKAAATYCNKQMQEYPGAYFTYSTQEVEPYYYPIKQFSEEKDDRIITTKI